MRRLTSFFLLVIFLVPASLAQEAAIPEAPVRYDTDLLPPSFHQNRRDAVKAALPDDAVAFFFSAPLRNRENDNDFEYRQDSDLYYLTGTHEQGSVLLLAPGGIEVDGELVTELLMVPPRNAFTEVWVGRLFGVERAQETLGIQKVVSNERFEEIAGPLLESETHHPYHLPFPEGVTPRSDLGQQLAFFQSHAQVLPEEGNFMVQNAMRFIMAVDTPEQFLRAQGGLAGRVKAIDFDDETLKAAFLAFMTAASLEEWQLWRRDNIDAAYANGVLLRNILTDLRSVKTEEEIALLQRAIDITVMAHREAMRSTEPGMHEYEIEALIEYIFKRNGAQYTGFPSIVGSGENSTILHYNTSRRQTQPDDMMVIDIGAEYHGYTADVTRTIPVDGTFSPEQKAIYEVVQRAQQAGIDASRAGNPFSAPGQAASQVVTEGLTELGLLKEGDNVRTFFMHGTSHYLGLYVHDVGDGGPLRPGQVITVEPGIYISPSPDVDPKWWNIGVRIEDDILITEGDPIVMSADAPRDVAEIEALMQERGLGNDEAGLVGTN